MKILFTCTLLVVFILVNAQNKIEGVGKFKVGKTTTNVIDELSKELKVTVKKSTGYSDYGYMGIIKKKTTEIFLLAENEEKDYNTDPKLVVGPNVKVYYIDYLDISGVPFTRVYLEFYRDTLYSFYSDGGNEITEALQLKYGKPKTEVKKKMIKCKSRLLGEFEEEEISYYSEWDSGIPFVGVIAVTSKYYNDKCEKKLLSFFNIYNTVKQDKAREEETALKDDAKKKGEAEQRKKLSEF